MAGGEVAVKSGDHGQKIVREFLKLFGWNIAEQVQYECGDGHKHRPKDNKKHDRQTHNIDGLFQYDNPLNHKDKDVTLISIKHNKDGYPSGIKTILNTAIKDIAECIECSDSSEIISSKYLTPTDKEVKFRGALFCFSSKVEELERSLIEEKNDVIVIPRINPFEIIYLFDNRKLSFLFSLIKTAIEYKAIKSGNLRFLYHHTGLNQNPEDIFVTDDILPLELMNSSLIPVVIESSIGSSVLLFCDNNFQSEYLKRIIWLAHKLCGLSNEIVIYFSDYDETKHDNDVQIVKQSFRDVYLISKVTVRRFDTRSFISLKESQRIHSIGNAGLNIVPFNQRIFSQKDDNELDKILPFGEMIKPIIGSSQLSATDLKDFLKSKGIIVKTSSKELIVPLFANMLMSPLELDVLKEMLKEKEDKAKTTTRRTKWIKEDKNLVNNLKKLKTSLIEIKLDTNCTLVEKPVLKRLSNQHVTIPIQIERVNTTKDLLTGTTQHKGNVEIQITDDGELKIKQEYTSKEVKNFTDKIVERINYYLLENRSIEKEARSVLFSDFISNEQRVDFLMSFSEVNFSSIFCNGNVLSIKFKPDPQSISLPTALDEMKTKVSNLNINGDELDSLSYVKEPIYKQCILLSKVLIRYDFSFQGNSGICEATVEFPSTLNSRTPDYTTKLQTTMSIPSIKANAAIISKKSSLERALSRKFDDLVNAKYTRISNLKSA